MKKLQKEFKNKGYELTYSEPAFGGVLWGLNMLQQRYSKDGMAEVYQMNSHGECVWSSGFIDREKAEEIISTKEKSEGETIR